MARVERASCQRGYHSNASGYVGKKQKQKNRSDITPDPGGHRPQRPCAQGRTYAKQDQPQASAPGQNRTQRVGGATTHGLRTRQAGKSVPTQTHPGNGVCTPQSTPQEGTLQQDPNTSASCAEGTYGRGQLKFTGAPRPTHGTKTWTASGFRTDCLFPSMLNMKSTVQTLDTLV